MEMSYQYHLRGNTWTDFRNNPLFVLFMLMHLCVYKCYRVPEGTNLYDVGKNNFDPAFLSWLHTHK